MQSGLRAVQHTAFVRSRDQASNLAKVLQRADRVPRNAKHLRSGCLKSLVLVPEGTYLCCAATGVCLLQMLLLSGSTAQTKMPELPQVLHHPLQLRRPLTLQLCLLFSLNDANNIPWEKRKGRRAVYHGTEPGRCCGLRSTLAPCSTLAVCGS